jgi:hypothetical protein
MKTHLQSCILALMLLTGGAFATTVDGKFVVLVNNGAVYSVKVQIRVDAAKDIGGTTLQFTYNTAHLSFPNSPVASVNYTFHNFSGGNYGASSVTKTMSNGNTLSLNIELNVDNGGTTVTTAWMDVATINFVTTNALGNSNLQWALREVYDEDNTNTWTLGTWTNENTTPLPVELLAFSAQRIGEKIHINWTTESELNNSGFVVERARDGKRWDSISYVEGHGTTDVRHDYSLIDPIPEDARGLRSLYYRLKQVNRDGAFVYSPVVEVRLPAAADVLVLNPAFPNPFNGSTTLSFTLSEPTTVTMLVINNAGQVVRRYNEQEILQPGYHSAQFESNDMPTGIYHLVVSTPERSFTQKLVLTK